MLTHSIDRPLAFTEVRNQRARLGAYNLRAARVASLLENIRLVRMWLAPTKSTLAYYIPA
jgi:hypothetical protein